MKRFFVLTVLATSAVLACTVTSGGPPDAGNTGADTGVATPDGSSTVLDSAPNDASLGDVATDANADALAVCLGPVVAMAIEDSGATVAQGVPEMKACTESQIAVSAGKYVASRAVLKFELGAAAAAKLASGAVQNVRVRLTLKTSTANAGQAPCLIGPPGNQTNNCLFSFQACPLTSAWTEAPLASCPSYTHQDPGGNVAWPATTFSASCGSSAPKDFSNGADHTGDVEIPIGAALLGPVVAGTKVSVYLPPLAPNSGFAFYSHEEADAAKRPRLLFDCNP